MTKGRSARPAVHRIRVGEKFEGVFDGSESLGADEHGGGAAICDDDPVRVAEARINHSDERSER